MARRQSGSGRIQIIPRMHRDTTRGAAGRSCREVSWPAAPGPAPCDRRQSAGRWCTQRDDSAESRTCICRFCRAAAIVHRTHRRRQRTSRRSPSIDRGPFAVRRTSRQHQQRPLHLAACPSAGLPTPLRMHRSRPRRRSGRRSLSIPSPGSGRPNATEATTTPTAAGACAPPLTPRAAWQRTSGRDVRPIDGRRRLEPRNAA